MNIRNFNLNLLKALDAILTEQHISRAADKIFITQPAMSNALKQLRELLGDELLVKGTKKMIPTPFALTLAPKVKRILYEIEQTLSQPISFDPKYLEHTFSLGMTDYSEYLLLPDLIAKITKEAPTVRLRIIHLNPIYDVGVFETNKIDFYIGTTDTKLQGMSEEILFIEDALCAARIDNPLINKKLTLSRYLKAKHLAIAFNQERSLTDISLEHHGTQRDIAISLPHLITAIHVLAKSPFIATLPEKLVLSFAHKLNLRYQKPPIIIPSVAIKQIWPNYYQDDPKHRWLRKIIKETAEKIDKRYREMKAHGSRKLVTTLLREDP